MKDWTVSNYSNFLWISDLLSLQSDSSKDLLYVSHNKRIPVRNVTIVGTIVAGKELGNKGWLYSVDDGTGVIVCKYNIDHFHELLNVAEEDCSNVTVNFEKNLSKPSRVSLGMTVNETVADDTIFNDRTIQPEEETALDHNRMMGLKSLMGKIVDSISPSVSNITLGDSVLVHGRIYSYFGVQQIYVNSLRIISMEEEFVRTRVKVENSHMTQHEVGNDSLQKLSTGITYDNVHHFEANRKDNVLKVSTPQGRNSTMSKPGTLVVTPRLEGVMTFDTLGNVHEDNSDGELTA